MIDIDRIALEVDQQLKEETYRAPPNVFAYAFIERLEQEGWQLVPVEPFDEALDILKRVRDGELGNCVAYRMLLAAAPKVSKWCSYCGKSSHTDSECHSTRPAAPKPENSHE